MVMPFDSALLMRTMAVWDTTSLDHRAPEAFDGAGYLLHLQIGFLPARQVIHEVSHALMRSLFAKSVDVPLSPQDRKWTEMVRQ